jgi:hypothetical protein
VLGLLWQLPESFEGYLHLPPFDLGQRVQDNIPFLVIERKILAEKVGNGLPLFSRQLVPFANGFFHGVALRRG